MVTQKRNLNLKVEKLTEEDVQSELDEFESRYGMTSSEFIRRYNRCEFEERESGVLGLGRLLLHCRSYGYAGRTRGSLNANLACAKIR